MSAKESKYELFAFQLCGIVSNLAPELSERAVHCGIGRLSDTERSLTKMTITSLSPKSRRLKISLITLKQLSPFFLANETLSILCNVLDQTLKFVDDFSAVIAVYFGADAKLTAFVWGSIRLMLSLASSAGDTLKDVLEMLEELSLILPRFRAYETNLPLDRPLETALIDVYTEVICFYARCIHFFRTHPHVLLRRDAWEDFRKDFSRTIRRIRRLSATVESEAESARMRHDRAKYNEILDLMETLKETQIKGDKTTQHHYIPSEVSPKFWGREDALMAIQEVLAPEGKPRFLKTFALYGMGGVGKTQIALQ